MNLGEYTAILSYLGTVAGLIVFFCWATITGFRKRSAAAQAKLEAKTAKLDEANAALIQVVKDEANAWKIRYETEHAEYLDYRQKAHLRDGDMTSRILELTTECADLKAKTDITPILQAQKDQQDINTKIVESLNTITQTSQVILDRLTKGKT